jgi:septal ring factor EnvC (AmiA/AmiB activator)
MLGKSDVIDSLSRDLARARDKRDALTSGVTTLTAQIAELEARLSAENDRRERERLASEIEAIKKQLEDKTNQLNISAVWQLEDSRGGNHSWQIAGHVSNRGVLSFHLARAIVEQT